MHCLPRRLRRKPAEFAGSHGTRGISPEKSVDQKYKLGIAELDDQHDAIENVLFSLEDALSVNDNGDMKHYLLEDLCRKLRAHFSFEEAIMRMFAYPNADEHAEAHRKLMGTINDYRRPALPEPDAGLPFFAAFREQILLHDTHFALYISGVKDRAGIMS